MDLGLDAVDVADEVFTRIARCSDVARFVAMLPPAWAPGA